MKEDDYNYSLGNIEQNIICTRNAKRKCDEMMWKAEIERAIHLHYEGCFEKLKSRFEKTNKDAKTSAPARTTLLLDKMMHDIDKLTTVVVRDGPLSNVHVISKDSIKILISNAAYIENPKK